MGERRTHQERTRGEGQERARGEGSLIKPCHTLIKLCHTLIELHHRAATIYTSSSPRPVAGMYDNVSVHWLEGEGGRITPRSRITRAHLLVLSQVCWPRLAVKVTIEWVRELVAARADLMELISNMDLLEWLFAAVNARRLVAEMSEVRLCIYNALRDTLNHALSGLNPNPFAHVKHTNTHV